MPTGRNRAAIRPNRWVSLRSAVRSPALSPSRPAAAVRLTARLAASPIAANGRVYTIDTLGVVRAFDARTGAQVWSSQTPTEKNNQASLYGGGIAYDNGKIFATNGLGFVAAIDDRNGGIVWQVRPGGPLRGAPDRGQRRGLCDQPGQSDLFAQGSRRLDQLVAGRVARNRRRVRLGLAGGGTGNGRRRASRRASSTPIATRTAARCGRTRCSAPASAPACRRSAISMPTRSSTTARSSRSARADAWSRST